MSTEPGPARPTPSYFDAMGGEAAFEQLVSHFYALVAVDPVLRPLYPDEDWHGAARRLQLFLMQYWGGPSTYHEERGHPRLRMRHVDFAIGPLERDHWIAHMMSAVDELALEPDLDRPLREYLVTAAHSLQNRA